MKRKVVGWSLVMFGLFVAGAVGAVAATGIGDVEL